MNEPLVTRVVAEFFGTMILILFGNGAIANCMLKGTKGNEKLTGRSNVGWLSIAIGYGCGVMIPAMMFGSISGNHLNPAVTIAQAVSGIFPWDNVIPYIIAQLLGAIVGQLIIVLMYWNLYKNTEDMNVIFGSFSTSEVSNNKISGFFSEFVGTFILMFCALGLYRGMFFHQNIDIANIGVGFLIMMLVLALGGTTGPALNPARDLGPRIVHALIPLKQKGSSHWDYSLIPIVAPIFGAICGALVYKVFFKL